MKHPRDHPNRSEIAFYGFMVVSTTLIGVTLVWACKTILTTLF